MEQQSSPLQLPSLPPLTTSIGEPHSQYQLNFCLKLFLSTTNLDLDDQVPRLVRSGGWGGLWTCSRAGQCHRSTILQQEVSDFHLSLPFQTRRGIANGIFMSGGALGNMLMPVLLRWELLPCHSCSLFGDNCSSTPNDQMITYFLTIADIL